MNKIFKTKYDVTTGQTKAVSELANNRQVASRSSNQPKCGVFFGGILELFKVLPLALVINGMFSSISYSANMWLEFKNDLGNSGGLHEGSGIWYERWDHGLSNPNRKETTLLTSGRNKTGAEANYQNKDFWRTVAIGSRAVAGGNDTTAVGYKAIVGINSKETKNGEKDSHQGTAVGYRAFSYGQESVSLGNDTVAYGASSISIGSDNVGQSKGNAGTINNPYSQKALSYDIWDLFHTHGSKFNYTGEYAATKNYSQIGVDKISA